MGDRTSTVNERKEEKKDNLSNSDETETERDKEAERKAW